MAFRNEYTLNVDLKRQFKNIIPTFVQYDTARLIFKIYDDNTPFDLSSITEIKIYHKRLDNVIVEGTCSLETINNEPCIVYDYLGNEMFKKGFVETTVAIYQDNKKVQIQPFKVMIVDNIMDGTIHPSNPEYGLLQRYIAQIEALIEVTEQELVVVSEIITRANNTIDDMTTLIAAVELDEVERNANEQIRIQNEDARIDAEDDRNLEEAQRQANELSRISNEDNRIEAENNRVHLGNYSNITNYVYGNIVSYNGSSYMNVSPSIGITPNNTSNWKLMGKKGDNGVGLNYVGTYSESRPYVVNELVTHNGRLFACIQDNTDIPPSDNLHWSLFLESSVVDIKQEEFILTDGQTIITLNEGEYLLGANAVSIYISGVRQPNYIFEEVSSSQIKLLANLPEGLIVMVEYFQFMDIELYANELKRIESENNRIHKGEYDSATTYNRHNEVLFEGSTWRCLVKSTGNEPEENTYWTLVARKGDNSNVTVIEEHIATEGQQVFTLHHSYVIAENRLRVSVGGVPQYSIYNYSETTENSITFSEGISEGVKVYIEITKDGMIPPSSFMEWEL